jgi:predicted RNA-binding Zn-ribbon protein involved in translation (DUF1610 family)
MAKFFYFDSNGTKQGPYDDARLVALAKNGSITPDTRIEYTSEKYPDGKQTLAGKIKGLFPPPIPVPSPVSSVDTVSPDNPFITPQPTTGTSSTGKPFINPPSAQPPSPPLMIYCSACGNQVLASAFVCPQCGTKVAKPQTPTPPQQPYVQPQYPPPMIYCSACGNQVLASAFVCPQCGTKVAKPQSDPQPFQILSPTEQTIKQLKLYFWLFCISFAACIPAMFIGLAIDAGYADFVANGPKGIGIGIPKNYDEYFDMQMTARSANQFFLMVGLCGLVAAIVFFILLYRLCRRQIPPGIPTRSFWQKSYWQRLKDGGLGGLVELGGQVNRAMELLGLRGTVNETLGRIVSWLFFVEVWLFVLGMRADTADERFGFTALDTAAFIALMITSIIYLNGLKDAVITLVQNRDQTAVPTRFE